jgi:hypothetical protein
LELPGVKRLAGGAIGKAAGILREHFLDSSHELGSAAQKSYEYGMLAISAGLADREADMGWLSMVSTEFQKLLKSKVSREFSAQIRDKYMLPYTQERGWDAARTADFGREVLDCCKSLAKQSEKILPTEALPEEMWAEMLKSHSGKFI